jgi:cell division protein ZapA (FtsZ GTPase activity inhibitor)
MNDKLKIKLFIGQVNLQMTINPSEEEVIRAAAKDVNNWFSKYKSHYQEVSDLQAMTMAAFNFAVECRKYSVRHDDSPYTTKIDELSKTLEECIRKYE